MPFELVYFATIIVICVTWFVVIRRPMYEAMFLSFFACVVISGSFGSAFSYMISGAKQSILYNILAFLIFSEILKQTGVIEKIINIIIALVGRLSGGAGMVCFAAATFFSFIAGSGPGTVSATGSITIPLMKRAGYKPELAAGIGAACAGLGPIVPPVSSLAVSFACLVAVVGDTVTLSELTMAAYGVALWFIVHRFIQTLIMCKAYKVRPLDKSELPDLRQAWKEGWSSCLLILFIMVPFIVDAKCGTFLTNALGATARKTLSSSLLSMIPAFAGAFCFIVGRKTFKFTLNNFAALAKKTVKSVAPMAMLLWMAYSIGACFDANDVGTPICNWIMGFNLTYFGAVLLVIFIAFLLTTCLSPNAVIPFFGPMIITLLSSYGLPAIVCAAMLIPMFHGFGQVSVPYATILYPAMGFAESDFGGTVKQSFIWMLGHAVVCAFILLGVLPIAFL